MAIGHRDYHKAHDLIDDFVNELQSEIDDKNDTIAHLENQIEARDNEIESLRDELKEAREN